MPQRLGVYRIIFFSTVTGTIIFTICSGGLHFGYAKQEKELKLKVIIQQIVDPRFKPLGKEEVKHVLDEARLLLKEKFKVTASIKHEDTIFQREGYSFLSYWPYKKEYYVTQDEFESESKLKGDDEYFRNPPLSKFDPKFVDIWGLFKGKELTFENYKEEIIGSFKKLKMEELNALLGSRLNSYEEIAEAFFQEYKKSLRNIKDCKVNGKPLFTKSWDDFVYESARWWTAQGFYANSEIGATKITFLLYNGPIFEDEIGIPHSMLAGFINGTTGVVSSFPVYQNPLCFQNQTGKIEKQMRAKTLAYGFVHEMGHLVFGLPDRFDKEKEGCMMYLGKKARKLADRYSLVKNKAACPDEVEAAYKNVEKLNKDAEKPDERRN